MRAVTATEKYNAVLEGKMAKKEFVRQMRQQYPMYISQFNGFDDTVQILKNRQMLYETIKPAFAEAKVYDDRPALTYSLDALDRGIRVELATMGVEPGQQSIKGDDLKKATKKAKDNLEKNPTHYLDLMSGESKKVDKHDKEKEVKRGAKDTDVMNGLKKATLKERYREEDRINPGNTPEQDKDREEYLSNVGSPSHMRKDEFEMSEDAKKNLLGQVVGALRTKYPEITAGVVKDFIKTHYQDLLDGADIEGEFEEYIYANYETASDFRDVDEKYDREEGDGHVGTNTDDDFEREMQQQLAQREAKGKVHDGDIDEQAKETTFDPKEIKSVSFPNGLEVTVGEPHPEEEGVVNFIRKGQNGYEIGFLDGSEGGSYAVDFNGEFLDEDDYIEEKKGKDHDGDGDIDGDDYMAAKDKAIKKAMGKEVDEIGMFNDPVGYDKNAASEDKRALELTKALIDKGMDKDTAIEKAAEKFSLRTSYLTRYVDKYMGKDEQIKEAVKSIIKKVLTEQNISEAATGNLSKFSDDYADFAGMTQIINQLENLVTEVEGFYAKTGEKLQKIFDSIGNVTNEEGLKVGGFIAPAIESAFKKDIQPVVKKGFMNSVQIPTIKQITQGEIDQFNAQGMAEEEMEEKQTMFTPVMESKKKK